MEPLPSLSSSCQAYWCHQCKKEFYLKKNSQDNGEVFCNYLFISIYLILLLNKGLNCKSDFCEEVMDSDNNPKNYIPYEYSQVIIISFLFINIFLRFLQNPRHKMKKPPSKSPD